LKSKQIILKAVHLLCFILSLSLNSVLYADNAEIQGSNMSQNIELQNLLNQVQKNKKLVGIGAVVLQHNEVKAIAVSGERKKKSGAALTVDDTWHLGSITKSITATMLAALVENDELNWSLTLGEHYSDSDIDPSWHSVTLHDLLTHTSGTPANFPISYQFKEFLPEGKQRSLQRQKAVLETLSKPIKQGQAGQFLYSNIGYTIAAVIAERVTDKSWETLVREKVYSPLNLSSAGFGNPDFQGGQLSQPRGHQSYFGFQRAVKQSDDNNPIMGPAGISHMTLTDLALYANEHLQGFKGKGQLLKSETYKLIHTPNKQEYAYGWVVFTEREWANGNVIWHNGSNTMWYAIVAILPELDAVVAITANEGRANLIEKEALDIFETLAESLK